MQRSYWRGSSSKVVHVDDDEADLPDDGDRAAFLERTVSGRKVGIKIRDLTKVSSHRIWLSSFSCAYISIQKLFYTICAFKLSVTVTLSPLYFCLFFIV